MQNDELRDRISAYLDGELADDERLRFEQAMAHDPALRSEVEDYRGIDALFWALPREAAPDDFLRCVADALEQPSERGERIRFRRRLEPRGLAPLLASAAVLLVVLGLVIYQYANPTDLARRQVASVSDEAAEQLRELRQSPEEQVQELGVNASELSAERDSTEERQPIPIDARKPGRSAGETLYSEEGAPGSLASPEPAPAVPSPAPVAAPEPAVAPHPAADREARVEAGPQATVEEPAATMPAPALERSVAADEVGVPGETDSAHQVIEQERFYARAPAAADAVAEQPVVGEERGDLPSAPRPESAPPAAPPAEAKADFGMGYGGGGAMGGFGGGLTGERATLGGMMGGGAAVPGLGGPGMPVAAGSVPTGGLLLLSGPRAFERVGDEWRQRGYAGQDAPLLPRDSQEFAGLASRFPELLPLTLQPDAVVFIVDDAWLRLAPAPKPESKPE